VFSRILGDEFTIESGIIKPLLKGAEIHAYSVDVPENVILFPYEVDGDSVALIGEPDLKASFPLAWKYLLAARKPLEAREGGKKWRIAKWWQFGRNQNIAEMGKRKLLTQVLAKKAAFTFDAQAEYCFVGGGNAGGYGIHVAATFGLDDRFVLGLLNSRLLDWYVKRVSTPFRGGFFSYARRFIEQLPIRQIDFNDRGDKAAHDRMVKLVDAMLALHKQLVAAESERQKTIIQRQIDATDREINRQVYGLYGLTEQDIAIVEGEGR